MRFVPLVLSCLVLAAHHSRGDESGLVLLWLSLPFVLFFKRRWIDRAVQIVLLAGALEWALTIKTIVDVRQTAGLPYGRMLLILGAVAVFTALSGLLLETAGRKNRLPADDPVGPGLGAFLFAALLMTCVQLFMHPTGMLAERFLYSAGWLEAFWLAIYAGWLSDRLQNPKLIRKLRPRVWLVFSVIFFTQLILGVAGLEKLLMTGKLHLPVPALIVAGPLFRGGGFFMARRRFFHGHPVHRFGVAGRSGLVQLAVLHRSLGRPVGARRQKALSPAEMAQPDAGDHPRADRGHRLRTGPAGSERGDRGLVGCGVRIVRGGFDGILVPSQRQHGPLATATWPTARPIAPWVGWLPDWEKSRPGA
jgi:hypothetical protein